MYTTVHSLQTYYKVLGKMARAVPMPSMTRKLLNQERPARQEVLEHGWNPADCSASMDLLADDPLTVKRRPVPSSTRGGRRTSLDASFARCFAIF